MRWSRTCRRVGAQAFLDEQFAAPASQYPRAQVRARGPAGDVLPDRSRSAVRARLLLAVPASERVLPERARGSDQLRQRVAFALSQILVTSGLDINLAYGMGAYQQIFRDNAFGNYEDILTKVTLSSVMGDYLNMVNNDKPSATASSPTKTTRASCMQLFSIGVWELNLDGTQMLDANGAPIPTYDQDTIEGFAHVFTGWTYPVLPGRARTHAQSEEFSRRHGAGRHQSRHRRESCCSTA